tara:strand:- start:587 stop:868 length:282 start_codon:yes stop_codon:yes gene_type:complete
MMQKYTDLEKKVLKPLAKNKLNLKNKGTADLEVQIETLKKEIDTLKAVIDLKDFEISTLSNNLKKEKDEHNKKIVDKWLDDLTNNTPHAEQFK